MSHCSRNQFPNPATANGLPNSVTRNVRCPLGVASMIDRKSEWIGICNSSPVVLSVFFRAQ